MADVAETVVLAFNEAISSRDVDSLTSLMTGGHRFIDPAGAVVAAAAVRAGVAPQGS
jgi:hypothetical protein